MGGCDILCGRPILQSCHLLFWFGTCTAEGPGSVFDLKRQGVNVRLCRRSCRHQRSWTDIPCCNLALQLSCKCKLTIWVMMHMMPIAVQSSSVLCSTGPTLHYIRTSRNPTPAEDDSRPGFFFRIGSQRDRRFDSPCQTCLVGTPWLSCRWLTGPILSRSFPDQTELQSITNPVIT